MSNQTSHEAYLDFQTAEIATNHPKMVTTSGTIPLSAILEITFTNKVGISNISSGLIDLTASIHHIEQKLNAIMTKLGLPIKPAP